MIEPVSQVPRHTTLDWLRLLLASQVVLMHVSGLHPFTFVYPVGGFVCISGYLIPDSFARSRSWAHFAWKRFLRVFPVFLLSLAAVAALAPSRLWVTIVGYLTMNILGRASANNALWSLMAEEILYAFHAITRAWYGPALAWIGLAASVAGLWMTTQYSYLPAVAGCFFAGNLLALNSRWRTWPLWSIVSAFLIVGIVQTVLTRAEAIGLIGRLGLPILGAAFLLMVGLRIRLPELRRDYSYSLYALHLPVLLLFPYSRPIRLLAMMTVMPVICAAVWRFIETPALRWKDWQPRRARVVEVGSTLE